MNFEERLKEKQAYANDVLSRIGVTEVEKYRTVITEAMNYSLLAGGKRLRPILMYTVYELFGGNLKKEVLESFMAAIELIHTYSLVHDDLPAMDNDLYRRGKKTTHAVYGEAMGILAGDALLNRAFEVAASAFDYCDDAESYLRTAKALKLLSMRAGSFGMVGGQAYDVLAEEQELALSEEDLEFIFKNKTCALIEAAMGIGAILAGAEDEARKDVDRIAYNIGMAFQIQDDILDVEGDEAELGKPIGSDEKNNKTTYVTLKGMEQAKKDVRRYSDEALSYIRTLKGDSEFLYALAESLVGRRS